MIRQFGVLTIFVTLACNAQTSHRVQPKTRPASALRLFPVATVVEDVDSSKTDWSLAFAYQSKEYKPKADGEAVSDLDKYIVAKPGADWGANLVAEHTLMAKYRLALESLVGVSVAPLLYTGKPVRLASHGGNLTLLLTSLASPSVFNTLKLDARERAGKEIEKAVLPEIRQFQVVNSPAFKYFGVVAVYGTKDFSEPDSTPKAELVALVAPAENCRKLANAEMTEEDFVAASDVYIEERNELGQLRKVQISLGTE